MSWAVGWDQELGRFRGYGVPAYCDAKGCEKEIDRGLGWIATRDDIGDESDEGRDDLADGAYFTCGYHDHGDVDRHDLPNEHPKWVEHVANDDSWSRWRELHPERLARLSSGGAA